MNAAIIVCSTLTNHVKAAQKKMNTNYPIIELDNQGYGIWYLDSLDNLDRYIGKTIQFTAMVLKPKEFPKKY